MQQPTITFPHYVADRLIHRSFVLNAITILLGSIIIAISAQFAIPVPFSLVPLTLQPLAVLLVGAVLGSRRGAASAALYLVEGFSGLPVFAGASTGIAVLLGPTAGYLWAFPVAAFIAGFFAERGWNRSVVLTSVAMMLATATLYLGGWSWLASAMHLGARSAFLIGVAPFVVSDLIKIAIATAVLPYGEAILRRFAR